MRALAVPALLLLATPGCKVLDPVALYREAAHRLSFSVERIQPKLDLRLPLDRSGLRIQLTLGVDNPSDLPMSFRGAKGTLWLEVGGRSHRLGDVALPEGLKLPAHGRGSIPTELTFAYGDLREAWNPLSEVILRDAKATWRLEGQATVEVLGLPLTLPFHTTRSQGGR